MEDNEKRSVMKIDLTDNIRIIIEIADDGDLQELFDSSTNILNSYIVDYQKMKLLNRIDEYMKSNPEKVRALLGIK